MNKIFIIKGNESIMQKNIKICIDPGHGGTDPGAVGQAGTKEKDVVLAISLLLRDLLLKQGFDVVMTHDEDIQFGKQTLSTRYKISNNANVDFFVSVHANAATNRSASGAETYVCSTAGKAYKLAKAVQQNMVDGCGLKDRGVKVAQYSVLINTKAPAILIETGFISNTEEECRLVSKEFQQQMAEFVARGIVEYLGETWVCNEENCNLKVTDVSTKKTSYYQLNQDNRDGTVWVPIRTLSEILGYDVTWDNGCVVLQK